MRLLISALGFLILLAWLIERRLGRHRARRRPPDNLRHITGSPHWWKEPPRDGPEGDH